MFDAPPQPNPAGKRGRIMNTSIAAPPMFLRRGDRPTDAKAPRGRPFTRSPQDGKLKVVPPKAGRRFTFATPDRSAFEFARVASNWRCNARTQTLNLVVVNLNLRCLKSLTDAFGMEEG